MPPKSCKKFRMWIKIFEIEANYQNFTTKLTNLALLFTGISFLIKTFQSRRQGEKSSSAVH